MPNSNTFKLGPIPSYGDHMPIEDFVVYVKTGCFIDYDGFGDYATDNEVTDISISPSDVKHGLDPRWTHIVWYNK